MIWLRHKAQTATTFSEFLSHYDPELLLSQPDALFGAVSNHNLIVRLEIVKRLIDDGADASHQESGNNVLHVLFDTADKRSPSDEAPMVRDLIKAGASVNLITRRSPTPMIFMLDSDYLPGEDSAPFYDVFLERPELDLSLPAEYGDDQTVREALEYMAAHSRPILGERLRLRDHKFGTAH